VLWALTRLHPGIRARLRESSKAFEEKRWRHDLAEWDDVDRPAAIAKHRAIQAVDVAALTNDALVEHVRGCVQHCADSIFLHHKYTVPSVLVTGDLLAGIEEWTGLTGGPVLQLLRGTSEISHGFGAGELADAAQAISGSETARTTLSEVGVSAEETLTALAADPSSGPAVTAYLEAVWFRCVGYDVGDQFAGEMPDVLVDSLRAAVGGAAAKPYDATIESDIRAKVPADHQAEFDERLAEARLVNRLRDERDAFSDGWATGLARRALLEVGRRLAASGQLLDREHAVDLTVDEVAALLGGSAEPTGAALAERYKFRTTHTTDDAPEHLGGEPVGPPPASLLPKHAQRAALAMGAALGNLFGVSEAENSATVLKGLAVNTGTYEGPARLVNNPVDFGRIQPGDVLVTRMTSPYFNVVLPLLGALVTDRGGQLCHAAIVAREYGIPGIVGTRDATATIRDGVRVRVDGSTGEVHVLG